MIKRLLLGLVALLVAAPALAQSYPTKPIRLVVGYSPGGGNDLIARIVATRLQEKLGQPVVVDNKPGAASILAAELVAKAPPDGYTLLMAPSGPLTINPAVYSKLPYDPVKDFAPISLLAEFPLMLVVGADQPIRSVKELVDYGKANPDKANYASSATPFQLASELFNQRTGSRFQHIPYRGSGDMAQAVASGQVLMAIADTGPIAGMINGGKLRALAISTSKRSPAFKDVPTMIEAGLSGLDVRLWTGVVAPAGTPAAVIARLNEAIRDVLALPAVEQAFANLAVDPVGTSPDEYRALIARDSARWKEVAATANIKVE
jgi:tripartite-type tricarboxylate transporter receptor subunit TctC